MDYVKVVVELDDKFSGKMRKITKEIIRFTKVTTLATTAVKRLALLNVAAVASFAVLNLSAKNAFTSIKKGSLSASSNLMLLTAQTALFGRVAKNASASFKGALPAAGAKGSSAAAAEGSGGGLLSTIGGAAVKSTYAVSKAALKLSSDAEQANIAFESMLGSSDKAKQFSDELAAFSNKSPFELPQIREASKKLLSYGMTAESVVPMLTAVGNATTGLGLGSESFDEITGALAKMKLDGKVSSEEMDKLVEAGIPAWDILSGKIKVSTDDLNEMAESGTLPADKALKDLTDGMNNRFPSAMAKQGQTLEGLYSQLKKTFENSLLQKWGDGISNALKPRLEMLMGWISQNSSTISQWGQMIHTAAFGATDAILNAFQFAFNYVKTQYFNNPEFMNLSVPAKIAFILDDLLNNFNTWLKSGGQEQISKTTELLAASLTDSIKTIVEPLLPVAQDIGIRIAGGIIEGLERTIAENPLLMTIIGGFLGAEMGAIFGPYGVLIGAGLGAGLGLYGSYAAKDAVAERDKVAAASNNSSVPFSNGPRLLPSQNVPSMYHHAGGLDRVPYNGYHALLHKDERVQTKAEADAWRSGDARSPLQFNFHYHGERMSEAEIDNVMGIFVRKMEALS
ncbi:tape measure protein [Paenibacillus rigui]|uniref:Tape measure protein N-terminal domain-containing protein n=1 Tax=Paenibacillus rigui TaxID=554312 RepID=A0A229USX2_9BACL|nr:tape measure protein [Paenibacillus rigui]OXM86460.1 hypothetical protein CF651_09800 [Paenibacillus rigui]